MTQTTTAAPLFRARHLAVVLSAMAAITPLFAADDAVPSPGGMPTPIVSAPSVKAAVALDGPGQPGAPGAAPGALPGVELDTDAPWVLPPDLHPLPLRFQPPSLPTLGYIDLPSIPEVRVMLPGKALDEAGRVRQLTGRGLTNAIGLAAQHRGRQMEQLDSWIASTEQMARQIKAANDPWQQYEFNKELRRELTRFRAAISGQSPASIQALAHESNRAVKAITPVMQASQGYEQSSAWYGVLVQLHDGVAMYQAQVNTADANMLSRVDGVLGQYPVVARPVGDPPADTRGQPTRRAEPAAPITKLQAAPIAEQAKPAVPVAPDNTVGILVMAGVIGLFAFLGLRFRKGRRNNAGARVEPGSGGA